MRQNGSRFLGLLVGCLGVSLLAPAGHSQAGRDAPSKEEIAKLFDKWNEALRSGKAEAVVKLYARDAVLLPTVSDKVRHNHVEIKDYFEHFLEYRPSGKIGGVLLALHGWAG